MREGILMTALSRRHVLAGAAATVAAAALPAVAGAEAATAKDWAWTGTTWEGRHPSSSAAVWWGRPHAFVALEARRRSVGVPRTYR